jgi:hypothetical protein
MQHITEESLHALIEHQLQGPAVTIYVPTHRYTTPPNMTEDQVRFKNLVSQAMERLHTMPKSAAVIARLQQEVPDLLDDATFWENQTEGFVMCAGDSHLTIMQLPYDTEAYVAVDTYYHLAPLFSIVAENKPYQVLTVMQHAPQLYEGDLYSIRATELALPSSVEAGLNLDEMNSKTEQGRSASGRSGSSAAFNGRGGAKNPHDEDLHRFFRAIDQLVMQQRNHAHPLPIVLAGTDRDVALYRDLSQYPNLVTSHIRINQGGEKNHELLAAAIGAIRESVTLPEQRAVVAEYVRLHGANPSRTADTITSVSTAAKSGRFTTDTVNDTITPVIRLSFPASDDKAIQAAATQVWQQRGTVINLDDARMPDHSTPMVARLRY